MSGVFVEIGGEPMRVGDVIHRLAQIAPRRFGAAFAGATGEHNRPARIQRGGQKRRLAIAGMPFDAHLSGINGFVGFKIIHGAAQSPRPRRERAPIVGLSRLALGHQPDDAGSQPAAVIILDRADFHRRVAPADGQKLIQRAARRRLRLRCREVAPARGAP